MSGIPHSSGTSDADLLQLNANIQELSSLVLHIVNNVIFGHQQDIRALIIDVAALNSTQVALEDRVTALEG